MRDDELALTLAAAAKAEASVGGVPASRLQASKRPWQLLGPCVPRNFIIFILFHYIHVLLVKTNRMIYNMLYKTCG